MPDQEVRVDPGQLRAAAGRLSTWSQGLAEHSSGISGLLPRALEDVEPSFDGSALGDAVGAVAVAVARAGDGLVTAVRELGEGLDEAAARYERTDRATARGLGGPGR